MKKRILTTILLLCTAIIGFAAIADLTGSWKGVLQMGDNNLELTYNFKVDGDKLTGAVVSPQGELPISEGKISGSDFSFKLDVNGTIIPNTGKYYGDSTVINSDFNGNKMHMKLTRVTK